MAFLIDSFKLLFLKVKKLLAIGKMHAFSLLEISFALIIMGIASHSFMRLTFSMMQMQRDKITQINVERINKAIANFAMSNGYLPFPHIIKSRYSCSGEIDCKFGEQASKLSNSEALSSFFYESTDGKLSNKAFGIVPFLTLGLDEKDAKDGNGNYFTYAVNIMMGEREEYEHIGMSRNYIGHDYDKDNLESLKNRNYAKMTGICGAKLYGKEEKNMVINVFRRKIKYFANTPPRHHYGTGYYLAILSDMSCFFEKSPHVFDRNGSDILKEAKKTHYMDVFHSIYDDDDSEGEIWGSSKYAGDRMRSASSRKKVSDYYNSDITYSVSKNMSDISCSQYKVCDTIAFVLISHGLNGGWFNRDGSKKPVRGSCAHKLENASNSMNFYQAGNISKGFDDKVFFLTKFVLASCYCDAPCRLGSF
ncbi:hypothetical protein FZC35_01695 [Candidatus Cytomitobacter indipagum]|uniref:Type II secretion system protein n=1 Tax=Candidatus Cytomitobacter indipagum TaxID=2601575 RepID=A0A5C0UEL3_9PROT|nr:hypothetical protein [Candidatus Cytomitobacter indipagum]QEK38083.1 hypothetical protein FZC35_01695 [Candidatus Cytomitobacter indipagum]